MIDVVKLFVDCLEIEIEIEMLMMEIYDFEELLVKVSCFLLYQIYLIMQVKMFFFLVMFEKMDVFVG